MPKRKKSDSDMKILQKRLKILEEEVLKKSATKRHSRRRRILSSDSSSSSSSESVTSANRSQNKDQISNTSITAAEEDVIPALQPASEESPLVTRPEDDQPDTENQPPMDENIIEILGTDPTKVNPYGKGIHEDLAIRLEHPAKEGLTKEIRKDLMDKYLIPDNCKLIDAPKLNPEVKAAISEVVIKRDKAIEAKQKITAAAISSLGEAVTLLLQKPDKNKEVLRLLMDAGRLMCDSQHNDSTTRRNYVMFAVKKEMKQSLQDTKIDSFLFGQNLGETLKIAKAINKSGADLKLTITKPNITKKYTPSNPKNWKSNISSRRQTANPKMRETNQSATAPKTQPQRWPSSKQSHSHRASYNRR